MDLLIFIFVAAVAVISEGLIVRGPSGPLVVPLGSSVVLPCYVDEPLLTEDLEAEWRRTDLDTLVHLYQDGESRPEAQQEEYHDRAHFFTDQIQHGNFSLRLDNLRAEDEGEYTCKVHSQQDSGETEVQIQDVERLLVSGSSRSISASVGEDVTLNCSVDSHIPSEDIEEVSWKRTDEDILVLLYQNNEALPDLSEEQYRDRVEFFTDEIPKGNFSLRLKSVRSEDKGVYMCEVFAGGLSANATVELERLASIRPLSRSVRLSSVGGTADLHVLYGALIGSLNGCCVLPAKAGMSSHLPAVASVPMTTARQASKVTGFSVLHIMVLILCISASGSALLLCCLIYCRSSDKGLIVQNSYNSKVHLGGSVVFPCHVPPNLLTEDMKVEWRRTRRISRTLVHLYQGGESRTEKQHEDYHDRAHFFTEHIKHGNFSLRLDNLRAEDEGKYTCRVYSKRNCVFSTTTHLVLKFFMTENYSYTEEVVPLGGPVVLPCYVDEPFLIESLKVEWRKTTGDSEILVHLYVDGESQPEAQQQGYCNRAHLFTKKIKDGNFSLRLKKVRAEDEGEYTCKVYSEQDCKDSADAELKLGFVVKHHYTPFPLGSSVVLPGYSDKAVPVEGLKVDWRRKGEALILYQDGESQAEDHDQHHRAHFVTDQIQHGNFSLRLDNLRAEDEGKYTCEVYSKRRSVFSAEINLVLRLLDTVFRLQKFLIVCPNILMFLAFVLWGVSEGSVNETVCCCALYFLRPLMILWAAPYNKEFTNKIKTWILKYSYVAEYVILSVVAYSALFSTAWQKLLNFAVFERVVIIVLFIIVFLCCFCKTIHLLVTEIGKKKGRIIEIFGLVADMISEILPTLQFVLLFYTFGSSGSGLIIIIILPVFMMMTNDTWFYRCRVRLGCEYLMNSDLISVFTALISLLY
ncbi:Butyrophilin-like protein 2 [Anabarilius grahami]|uniref:Butyrophilin-like protein 2 n=1 Tax=Anabarilius grahami TaxID=495550 RepID=A0A3N0YW03_ANAGA|nr:Butyrophilin-like protein 2 [Anabarilius grahami]